MVYLYVCQHILTVREGWQEESMKVHYLAFIGDGDFSSCYHGTEQHGTLQSREVGHKRRVYQPCAQEGGDYPP